MPSPIVIKYEDEDEDLVIMSVGPISHVQPTGTQAQAQVSVAPPQQEDQAKRERKKAILRKRLEQLKIEQELLEMEDWVCLEVPNCAELARVQNGYWR